MVRRKRILKHLTEGGIKGNIKFREAEEEDVISYWMTVRKS